MTPWIISVDNTITFMKPNFVSKVINILKTERFTDELEYIGQITFVYVLTITYNDELETTVTMNQAIMNYTCIGSLLLLDLGEEMF